MSLPKSEQAKVKKPKRGAVHGVGAGKFRGYYYPVNFGPRARELKRNLLLNGEAKELKALKEKEKVRSTAMTFFIFILSGRFFLFNVFFVVGRKT